jgi:hypothetical protein
MTDPRRYRIHIEEDIMERIRPLADKEFNRNCTKAVNQLLRKALAARTKNTNGRTT